MASLPTLQSCTGCYMQPRLPLTNDAAADSLIETYHQESLESGARIRDGLSQAVEQAIFDFGNGFLSHPHNDTLRAAAVSGKLKADVYYQQLLRLIYRLLFLMVIEERDLIFPVDAPKTRRNKYRKFYSIDRLRRLSEKRYLWTSAVTTSGSPCRQASVS